MKRIAIGERFIMTVNRPKEKCDEFRDKLNQYYLTYTFETYAHHAALMMFEIEFEGLEHAASIIPRLFPVTDGSQIDKLIENWHDETNDENTEDIPDEN